MGTTLAAGDRIGHYTIESELGRGPLGVSYQARDAAGDPVAIKVLESSTALSDGEKAQIARDFHLLEDLQSPQIPMLLEFVRYDEHYVIATDYLPLGNLEARLERGPLPLPAALTLMRHLTYAVGRAHSVGVVHGAIKPTNVLRREVDGRQVPVLTDFGGVLRRHPWRTPGGALDALAYRAPELGRSRDTSTAGDVFALGRLLSTMVGPQAPDEIKTIVTTATEPDPALRYRNAQEMFAALNAVGTPTLTSVAAAPAPVAAVTPAAVAVTEPAPAQERPVADAARSAGPAEVPSVGRILSAAGVEAAAADRGYRSRWPWIVGVIAVAVLALVLSISLSGGKGSVFTGTKQVPAAPVASAKPGYRSVVFTVSRPAGDASVVEVRKGSTWSQVGSTTYALPTAAGGTRACATFRVSDDSQTPALHSATTRSCGTSLPPSLSVKFVQKDCTYAGYRQVCYTFLASGLRPGTTHTLTLRLNGQVLGTRVLTVDKTGHAALPSGQHFHFEATAGGETAQVTYAGLQSTFIVANI